MSKRAIGWSVVWLVLLGAVAPSALAQKLLHSQRSLYREVLVYQDQDERCMCFTRNCRVGRQTCMDMRHPERFVMNYPRMMMAALYAKPAPRSVLIIGLGGGTLPRALAEVLPTARIDVVEIDPAVVQVARKYFLFAPSEQTQVIEADGRVFVKRALREQRHYDLIMLDAFDHEYIPEHLLTEEFLREVQGLLAPGGVLAANTFSSSRLYDHESVTYSAVFGTYFNLKRENRVIIAMQGGSLPDSSQLEANSMQLANALRPLGISAPGLLALFSTTPDWDAKARKLTDQYSPANLLNRRE
jgi:spermidine synthase